MPPELDQPIAPKNPFGPIPPAEFKALVACPYGEAKKAIRKYDPLFGLEPGEKIKFHVRLERTVDETGYAEVEASTKEEAEKLAADLDDAQIDWQADYNYGNAEFVKEVTPEGLRKQDGR